MPKKRNTHEIVKYHNSLNTVPFAVLTQRELNVFFAICSKLKKDEKDKDELTNEVTLTFKELRALTGCEGVTSNSIFSEIILNTNDRLLKATPAFVREDGTVVQFSLFKQFETNAKNGTLKVSVNESFIYILSAASQFTRFELDEYVRIKSVYAKVAYQNLKQWRHIGEWAVDVESFREIFMIPQSFKASHINDRVLKPILKELTPYFKNLYIDKIHGKGSGRPIVKYKFIFDPEDRYARAIEYPENKTIGIIEDDSSYSFKAGSHICPICGGILIEKEMNGSIAWCHADGWKDNARCKAIFNSVAEIKGYKEK